MKKRQFVDFWRNLPIFGKKNHLFGDFQWKMSKLLFICHFRRFLAQKSPNWLFLVKNRQIGDFCNANRQIGDKQQWHTLVSSQIIIWDQVYTQNPLVEVSKDVYTVVILLCAGEGLGNRGQRLHSFCTEVRFDPQHQQHQHCTTWIY